jgi:hypothetical protein
VSKGVLSLFLAKGKLLKHSPQQAWCGLYSPPPHPDTPGVARAAGNGGIICAGMDMNALIPQHPQPLERNPTGDLMREEGLKWMSPPYSTDS